MAIIMEPIVNVSITVPENCMGDVAGDLFGMRGSVKGTNVLEAGMPVVFDVFEPESGTAIPPASPQP